MLWPELWSFVLAVVYKRQRTREWVWRYSSKVRAYDDVHSERFRLEYRGIYRCCTCPRCIEEAFGHFDEWVQIF